jgi:hypothetical protein
MNKGIVVTFVGVAAAAGTSGVALAHGSKHSSHAAPSLASWSSC